MKSTSHAPERIWSRVINSIWWYVGWFAYSLTLLIWRGADDTIGWVRVTSAILWALLLGMQLGSRYEVD
jgi:hypothetical protein